MSESLKDGEPCGHPGCLSHVTHPCEGCGRLRGKKIVMKPGFHIRQNRAFAWNVYFKRTKLIGGLIGEGDAVAWMEEHNENGERIVPLEPLVMTKFDWQK